MRKMSPIVVGAILLPAICHASPWDSGNFLGGDDMDGLLYWVVSVVVMVVLLGVHFVARGTSVEMKHEPGSTAHKVRNATRVLVMMATVVSVFCWLGVLGEISGQTFVVYAIVYAAIFTLYFRSRAKRLSEKGNNEPRE